MLEKTSGFGVRKKKGIRKAPANEQCGSGLREEGDLGLLTCNQAPVLTLHAVPSWVFLAGPGTLAHTGAPWRGSNGAGDPRSFGKFTESIDPAAPPHRSPSASLSSFFFVAEEVLMLTLLNVSHAACIWKLAFMLLI